MKKLVINGSIVITGVTDYVDYSLVGPWAAVDKTPDMPFMRQAVAAINDEQILIAGGAHYGSDTYTDKTYLYDIDGTVHEKQPLPVGRYNAQMQPLGNGAVLWCGFSKNKGYLGDAYKYDLDTNSWTLAPDYYYPINTQGHCSAVVAGVIYSFGGHIGAFQDDAFRHDGNSWERIQSLPHPLHYAAATAIGNGKILIVGGMKSTGRTDECWIYDTVTNMYEPTTPLPIAGRGWFAETMDDGNVVVGSPSTGGDYIKSTYIYDVDSKRWSQGDDMKSAKGFACSAVVDGDVYLVGGNNPGKQTHSNEIVKNR